MNDAARLLVLFVCSPLIGVAIVLWGLILPCAIAIVFVIYLVKPTRNQP